MAALRATGTAFCSPYSAKSTLGSSLAPLLRQFHGEVRRMHHAPTSGSVKLHSWISALGQQGTEVQDGKSSTLGCMSLYAPDSLEPTRFTHLLPRGYACVTPSYRGA